MQEPIISVSGLRGIIGESLAPPVVVKYVTAFAASLPPGPVVLTRDGRSSGPMLAHAIRSALMAVGRDVLDGDVAATPTTGVLVRTLGASGGVQISASHNPPEYNGIKLFGQDGRVISAPSGQAVIDRMADEPEWVTFDQLGAVRRIDDPHKAHIERVLATVDVPSIRDRRFRVMLDSNHGAGSLAGLRLLDALGCEVVVVGGQPDGQFEHPPEPTRENLRSVATRAREQGIAVVFCQDPDADRLAIIDSSGNYIGEEYTLALTLKNRLSRSPGDCVINCATSRMAIDIAAEFGCVCHLSAVGEANVCDMMIETGAVYGGEGNGGPIDPRVGYVRDSLVGMAQVLELMAASGKSIAELVEDIPRYAIHKARATVDRSQLPRINGRLKELFSGAATSELDGLRFDWPDRWLLVRPSNTEPIVRIIGEAADEQTTERLVAEAMHVVRSV